VEVSVGRQAGVEKQREIIRALLSDLEISTDRLKEVFAKRGFTIETSTVEHLRSVLRLVIDEQARAGLR
jgi:hypothetical protein